VRGDAAAKICAAPSALGNFIRHYPGLTAGPSALPSLSRCAGNISLSSLADLGLCRGNQALHRQECLCSISLCVPLDESNIRNISVLDIADTRRFTQYNITVFDSNDFPVNVIIT
jgi:hypothetical protein